MVQLINSCLKFEKNQPHNPTLKRCDRKLQCPSSTSAPLTSTLLPHYTLCYSNSIHRLLPLGPHVNHVCLQQLSLSLVSSPKLFHCLSTRSEKKKKCEASGLPTLYKKREGGSHSKRHSVVLLVAVQLHWDRWGFKLLCRRVLQQWFLRVREHSAHNSPTQTFPASPPS